MEWKKEHDLILCREILVAKPFSHKERTTERGKIWGEIADRLKSYETPKFKETVTKRAVRERFKLLREKYKQRLRQQERASGINVEPSEMDTALEEICAEEDAAMEMQDISDAMKKKVEEDKEKAGDMRLKAMEKLGETNKRKSEDERKPKRKRSGDLNIEYLREKSEKEFQLRQQELEQKKSEKAEMLQMQQQMFAMIQQQQHQQQQQQQVQLQQNQMLISLLDKLVQK